ncbi:uncharacterized protein LY79DRAFT_171841 [Colletotrichum navitas]|uniref:Uncharacterized protein n=1 Tax=Colletotrichum navitas TaxID=681940 RepID=A0AAD8Q1X7_9PEZI|nr:uncharacterized protein LY79DRAFT_171841 [Colletotrichum navitas]KAK1593831.1 hypothetical protein LY79DRAFT_171841 [Colletotrichum navitas]
MMPLVWRGGLGLATGSARHGRGPSYSTAPSVGRSAKQKRERNPPHRHRAKYGRLSPVPSRLLSPSLISVHPGRMFAPGRPGRFDRRPPARPFPCPGTSIPEPKSLCHFEIHDRLIIASVQPQGNCGSTADYGCESDNQPPPPCRPICHGGRSEPLRRLKLSQL